MEDMDRVTMVGVDAEGVPPMHKAHTTILNNHSYMPVSLHVLYQEAVWMDKMKLAMQAGLTHFLGSFVDNFFLARKPRLCEKCGANHEDAKRDPTKYVDPKRCLSCELRAVLPEAVVRSRS